MPAGSLEKLRRENAELRLKLQEAEQTLAAIRSGEVDALVVEGPGGPRLFALEGVNHSYRLFVEEMSEGAAILNEEGVLLYCNGRLASLLGLPLEQVMGSDARDHVAEHDRAAFEALLQDAESGVGRGEVALRSLGGEKVPAFLSLSALDDGSRRVRCLLATDLRDQKRQEELVASEALARSVIEQAAEAIVVCDERGRVVRSSAAAARLCEGDPRWRPFEEAFALELSAPEGGGAVPRALGGAVLRAAPGTVRLPDGGRVEVLVSAGAVHGAAGRVLGCVVSMVDVTESRRAEAALRESEERFRSVLENSLDLAFRRDLQSGALDYVSPAVEATYGFTAAEFSAMSVEDRLARVHPEDRPVLAAAMEEAKHSGRLVADYRLRCKDGVYRWFAERGAVVRDGSGRPRFRTGAVRDISERKEAEQALRESEARAQQRLSEIESIYASAHVGLAVLDRQLRYVRINERLAQMNGASVAAHLGRTMREVVPSLADIFEALAAQVLESGRPLLGVEVSGTTGAAPAGDHTWIEHWLPLKDGAGEVTGINVVVEEITELKQVEEELRRANRELAEADLRKNEFLAVLSHELRNPLAPIRNSVYLLQHASPDEAQARRALEVVERQAGQLSRLVGDLLDVTRISSGKVHLQRERLELGELVRRTVEDQRSLFEEAGVRLELSPAARPLFVHGDPNRLAQILGNLLQNAAKFTDPGGRTRVEVGCDEARGWAELRVCDSGMGLSPEMLGRLFQPFSQADAGLDRGKGGLGLGLALVKGLVELHGGEVSARSAGPGKGAQFAVRLPLAGPEVGAAKEKRPCAVPARRRVLVIEDNLDAAETLCEVLALGQHQIAVAHSGPEGIEKARQLRPEIVFCDIGLPGMDGYQVARALRAEEGLRGAYLVALTGYALPDDQRRASEAGFDLHLAKPPSLEKLDEVLAAPRVPPGGP